MTVSNCCGSPATSNGDNDLRDYGICSDCGEHCEYVDELEDDASLDLPNPNEQ